MEKTHDVSVDEPSVAHQAILFILDVLFRNGQEMDVDSLYQTFGHSTFTPQMLRAVGNSEDGLTAFLQRYPSLFTMSQIRSSPTNTVDENTWPTNKGKISVRATNGIDSSSVFAGISGSGKPNSSFSSTNSNGISGGRINRISDMSGSGGHGGLANPSCRSLFQPSLITNRSAHASKFGVENGTSTNLLLSNDGIKWDSKTMKAIEQEALTFFKKQMARKEDEWLPIVSVAGHASQASPDIRKFVGPQNEFIHFLKRYPDIFLVREDFCGLKGKADKPGVRFPPPSPPPKRRSSDNSLVSRSTSFNKHTMSACGSRFLGTNPKCASFRTMGSSINTSPSLTTSSSSSNPYHSGNASSETTSNSHQLQLGPLEVKAVHYIMRLLHRCGKTLVQNIPTLLVRAPEPLAKTIGLTRDQCVQFFKLHSAIFQLHPDSCVSVKQDAVRALIHKDKSLTENSVFTGSGIILRIFPKYGILNTENNEQVFFDIQSCQFESFSDLTCILHPGDRLWFNAILGPKDGSTKWRSLKTWIKMKHQSQNPCLSQSLSNENSAKCSSNNTQFAGSAHTSTSHSTSAASSCSKTSTSELDKANLYDSEMRLDESRSSGKPCCTKTNCQKDHLKEPCPFFSSKADIDLGQYELPMDSTSLFPINSNGVTDMMSTASEEDDKCSIARAKCQNNEHIKVSVDDPSSNKYSQHEGSHFADGSIIFEQYQKANAQCKLSESLRSTSMMDLRALASSLPVITPASGRLEFVPIEGPTTSDEHSLCRFPSKSKNDSSTSSNVTNPADSSDEILESNTTQCHEGFNNCIDPKSVQNQVFSKSNLSVSGTCAVDDRHVSTSAQTISSGDILATNVFVD